MKKLILLVLLAAAAWQIYVRQSVQVLTNADLYLMDIPYLAASNSSQSNSQRYSCDGRQYCSQMTSCDEATYFIQNCPNTKMDGDHDGIPCESQFCR